MNIINKFIAEKNEKGIILELYENGLKQHEIEQFIIDKFKPFLKNKSLLKVQLLAYLPPYVDILLHIVSDNEDKKIFEKCLDIFWRAKLEDSVNCYNSYSYWQDELLEAISKIINLIILDQDRSIMSLHEFTEDVFTKVGKIIEACIQPYLRILLFLEKVIHIKKPSKSDIDKKSLGEVINELRNYKDFDKLLILPPWDLKLNDWRNISKHDRYSVKDNKIVGKYIKALKEEEITLFKPELWKLFLRLNDIFDILRLAHSLFFLDNIDDIQPYWENKQLREESNLLELIYLYNTFGFSVEKYSVELNSVKFKLKDNTLMKVDMRFIQLLSLLRPTWYKTRKRYISLEYFNSQNNPIFLIESDTSKREDIFSPNIDEKVVTIENLKESCKLTDFRKG